MHLNYFASKLKKLNVLLVEDNIIYGKFLQSLLAEYAIKSDLAENGLQALEKLKNNRYDIVLMDIEMSLMNGYQAATAIRNELKNDIAIIAMTANDTVEEYEKCILVGMNDCISKPVATELLFEKMYYASTAKFAKSKHQSVENKLISLDFLMENMGEKEDELIEIIDIFRIQLPKDVSELSDSIIKSDFPGITHYAHRMKSTVALMGVSKIFDLAGEIEALGRAKTGIEKIHTLHKSIIDLSIQALNEMQEERDKLTVRVKK